MKRHIAWFLALACMVSLFCGCGPSEAVPSAAPASAAPVTAAPATAAPASAAPVTAAPVTAAPSEDPAPQSPLAPGKVALDAEGWPTEKYEYPLPLTEDDATFSLFTISYVPQYIPEEGIGAVPIWKNMMDMTGVHIEYMVSSAAACAEQFATLLASDSLPDIISQGTNRYSGTVREAIEDGWFANILDYRAYIPNYIYEIRRMSRQNPTVGERAFLDDSTAAAFLQLRPFSGGMGWFIREDMLEKQGLGKANEIKTIDRLHDVFSALKVAYGDTGFYPLALFNCFELSGGKLLSGYNTALFTFSLGYYKRVRGGHVEYCGATDDDKAALTTLNAWWNEGLIDPNWGSYAGNADLESNFSNSLVGYAWLTPDDTIKRNALCVDADCRFMPTPRLRLDEKQTLKWGLATDPVGPGNYVLNAKCADIPVAISWIDWQYSDAGSEYISWGPEGDLWAYNEAGERRLTDFILNNPAGSTWIMQLYGANTMSDGGMIDTTRNYAVDGGKALLEMNAVWDISSYYDGEYDWHYNIQPDDSESAEISSLSSDFNTYYAETYTQFMVGDKPLSEWDSYIETLNELGLSQVYAIYDQIYARCMK